MMSKKRTSSQNSAKTNRKNAVRASKRRNKRHKLPYTSVGERQTMQVLRNLGHTVNEIASILNCGRATVFRQLKKFKLNGNFLDKQKPGRPRKITEQIELRLVSLVESNRKLTSALLSKTIQEEFDLSVSDQQIRKVLNKHGYVGGVCSRKPLLREANKVKRLAFARKHVNKPLTFWYKVLFTDEKKFELFNLCTNYFVFPKSQNMLFQHCESLFFTKSPH